MSSLSGGSDPPPACRGESRRDNKQYYILHMTSATVAALLVPLTTFLGGEILGSSFSEEGHGESSILPVYHGIYEYGYYNLYKKTETSF